MDKSVEINFYKKTANQPQIPLNTHNDISPTMHYATGTILTPNQLTPGYIAYENTGIHDIQFNTTPPSTTISGILVPTFINSHTHLGDAFIYSQKHQIPHTIKEAVAPPNGLKHKLLETTPKQTIQNGIKQALNDMTEHHTQWFCDFREGGLPGIQLLKQPLLNTNLNGIILARPKNNTCNPTELQKLLTHADGIGLSSISDWDYSLVQKIAQITHSKNKIFALHASEAFRENIDLILELKPHLLIHMTQATKNDLTHVADEQIPIVICPRSNHYFNITPPYKLFKETHTTLLLGTDNAMLTPPNILKEMQFLQQHTTQFTLEELLTMITYTPRKALNLDDHIPGLNLPRSFVVLHHKSLEPLLKI